VTSQEPAQIHCPDCGTPIVLLPLRLYTGIEELDREDMPDVVPHTWGAMFAIVDDDGSYTCPKCKNPQLAGR
jgi:predicted RNA-binding Zn-ribbon protein involved in translation (DUF1610 family)